MILILSDTLAQAFLPLRDSSILMVSDLRLFSHFTHQTFFYPIVRSMMIWNSLNIDMTDFFYKANIYCQMPLSILQMKTIWYANKNTLNMMVQVLMVFGWGFICYLICVLKEMQQSQEYLEIFRAPFYIL